MGLTVNVQHWRYEDGKPEAIMPDYPHLLKLYPSGFRDAIPKGWYCWCYPNDDGAFQDWMEVNCPKADITHRFNSGDPMWQTFIKNKKEATVFTLRWL